METLAARLRAELDRIPLIDPHSHVDPRAPAATSLNDLLGYHYYTELAHSAGMPTAALEATGLELARRLARWLPSLANTVQYSWLLRIAREFFGFPHRDLDPGNVAELFHAVERIAAAPGWADEVCRRSNLEAIFLTNDFDDPLAGFDTTRYVPCLRTDELAFKLDQPAVRERFGRATGQDATKLSGLEAGLDKLFDHFVAKGARACAISLPPGVEPNERRDVQNSLDLWLSGNYSGASSVRDWMLDQLALRCAQHGLPFDLMIGVNRDVYPAGVPQGRDLYDQRTSLRQFADFFNRHRDVVFPVSVLTHPQNQELCSYAWIFPNVVAHGHWWYSNLPAYIEADLRGRLEAVPANKLVGYYSDAYKLEFVLPKFAMYRECLARVLAREYVVGRRWPEERAIDLGRRLLRDNVLATFPGAAK